MSHTDGLHDVSLAHGKETESSHGDVSNSENTGVKHTPESCLVKKVSTTNATVSFCIPDGNVAPHYRYSISSKPIQPVNDEIRRTSSNNEIENINISNNKKDSPEIDDELQEKDCTVHMPGDFFYFNPEQDKLNQLIRNDEIENNEINNNSANGNITNKPNNIEGENNNNNNKSLPSEESNKYVFKKTELDYDNIIPFKQYFQMEDDKKLHILLGATGSVATIKIPLIIDKLFKIYPIDKISIQLIVTKPAEHFLNGLKINKNVKIWREEDSISMNYNFNETLLFHELSRWADIFLIAPLSANSLAKLANGICNNLLTSVIRDWSVSKTPILVAPAMNTFMYINPITRRHLNMLKENFPFLEILKPVEKVLICGDIGMGGMREWVDIVEQLRIRLKEILRSRNENEMDNEDKELATEKEVIDEDDEDEDENEDEDNEEEDDEDEDDDDDDDDDDEDDEIAGVEETDGKQKDTDTLQNPPEPTTAVKDSTGEVHDPPRPKSILQR